MVNFMHQGQQATNFTLGKAFSRKPRQVVAGQVSQHLALVLSERHGHGDELLQVFGVHLAAFKKVARGAYRGRSCAVLVIGES